MTDIAKALAFAKDCLKWQDPFTESEDDCLYVGENNTADFFDLRSAVDTQSVLEAFLGKRFFIQIARGTTSLFKWQVIVGLQDRAGRPATTFDHGCAEGDDMWDAVFDACVAAARLYPA